MGKHFRREFDANGAFRSERKLKSIRAEEGLDGLYVIRTSMAETELGRAEAVRTSKQLALVDRRGRARETS